MPASFAYGRRDGRLVHIGDLHERDRGLACGCMCPDCGRPLQAHLGKKQAWHFQHHVEEASCNPQPMTVLHAFVRDELASRATLKIPEVRVFRELLIVDEIVPTWVPVIGQSFDFKSARAELRGDGVQPDVVYERRGGGTLALEVRYTHAVDEEKRERLERNYSQAVEFNVSDLPAEGIGRDELEKLLEEDWRWTWLHNWNVLHAELRVVQTLKWAKETWRPGIDFAKTPESRPASQKLRLAAKRMSWAEEAVASLKKDRRGRDAATEWLGTQNNVDRIAIACSALGLDPTKLPSFMQQLLPPDRPRGAFEHHPYSWQPLVFMKFCVGSREFSAHEAAEWCVMAMPDRCELEVGTQSLNGFTRTAAALQLYFLQLEAQGLLIGQQFATRDVRKFKPTFATPKDLQIFLQGAKTSSGGPLNGVGFARKLANLRNLAASKNDAAVRG